MDKNKFYENVVRKLKEIYGTGWEVTITYIPNNNGIIKTAFNIREGDNIISPTIYAEDYYNMYEQGISFDVIIEKIMHAYKTSGVEKISFDAKIITDWKNVKGRLAVKVISKKRNVPELGNYIWREYLDLAIVPIIYLGNEDRAVNNNRKLFKTTCRNVSDVISGLPDAKGPDDIPDTPMKVLTNADGINGASTILDTGALNELYEDWGGPFYIIPSSIHELICMPAAGKNPEGLLTMVKDVNSTMVLAEEVLSDNVYIFDGSTVKVITAEGDGSHV